MHDRQTNTTKVVDLYGSNLGGIQGCLIWPPSIALTARLSRLTGNEPGLPVAGYHALVRRMSQPGLQMLDVTPTGATGNGMSHHATISDDGNVAAFASTASDLVVRDGNSTWDVFARTCRRTPPTGFRCPRLVETPMAAAGR